MEVAALFQCEVEVRARGRLLCFADLQVEAQYMSLGFIIRAIETTVEIIMM